MKSFKLLFASCLFVLAFCAAASAQNLNIGMVPLPCSSYGAVASLPVTLTNAPGISIAAVSADISFDETYFEYIDATIGAAGTAAGKGIVGTIQGPGLVRVGVLSTANVTVIGDGVVAIVNFKLLKNPVGGINITLAAGASDPAGANVVITSTTTGGFFTVKTGDTNMDGTVDIAEVLATVSMFLGLATVDPICDVNGDGIVQISDLVKVINCALETATCACDVNPSTTSEETRWQGSGHADSGAMAFNDWNDAGSISAGCNKCHSTPGYIHYVTDPDNSTHILTAVATGTVINCTACHDAAAEALTSVIFESSGSTAAPVVAKVTVSGLGAEARCIVCHQSRQSTATTDAYVQSRATLRTNPDAVDTGASARNPHYLGAAGVQYGTVTKVGYQYSGKIYDAKFAHVDGYDTCITCHDPHSLEIKYDACVTCHTGASDVAGLENIRMKGSLEDYDGDGNITEGIYAEVQGVKAKLLTAIQQYANVVGGRSIGWYGATPDSGSFYTDNNSDGTIDPVTETSSYKRYTARLLKACYNYQITAKDPGSYAHGGKYVIQLMYDSIEDLNAGLAIVSPATVPAVDLTTLTRNDEGHFNGGSEVFRHWDSTGVIPGGTTGCVKCHAGEGIPFFLTNGINIADVPSDGMMCVNCHSSVTDGIAPHTAPRRVVNSVTFPSGLVAGFGAADDSNLCLLCHQARESTVSLNAKIAAAPGSTTLSFTNSHYFAAGATLFGTQAKSAYEYATRTYAGQNPFDSHGGLFNKCVQCHMGSNSPTGNKSHNVAAVINVNCICHYGDVSQTPGDFQFENIRPIAGVGNTDFDSDGNVTESLQSEIAGLEAQLLVAIQAYAIATAGITRPIVYNGAGYPYWFLDSAPVTGVLGPEDTTAFGNHFDAKLLEACYNYNYFQKDPNSFIHSPLYTAQILHDSIRDLNGAADAAWRATAAY